MDNARARQSNAWLKYSERCEEGVSHEAERDALIRLSDTLDDIINELRAENARLLADYDRLTTNVNNVYVLLERNPGQLSDLVRHLLGIGASLPVRENERE